MASVLMMKKFNKPEIGQDTLSYLYVRIVARVEITPGRDGSPPFASVLYRPRRSGGLPPGSSPALSLLCSTGTRGGSNHYR